MAEPQPGTPIFERRGRDSLSSQDRGALKYGLNTIMEESELEYEQELQWPRTPSSHHQLSRGHDRGNAHLRKITDWLSPMSDHFPTPRGFHFMPAPILPSSPSSGSFNASSPWQGNDGSDGGDDASCAGTDSTEFDDLCEVNDGDASEASAARQHQSSGPRRSPPPPPLVIPTRHDPLHVDGLTDVPNMDKDEQAWMSPVTQVNSAVQLSPETIEMMERRQAIDIPDISAPPSLDGSLDSDQLAGLSSPPTPIIGPDDARGGSERATWQGVRLEPAALATLRSLSRGDDEASVKDGEEMVETRRVPGAAVPGQRSMTETSRQAPLRLLTHLNRAGMRPLSDSAGAGSDSPLATMSMVSRTPELTRLEIPSPNTFFANLTPGTRNTWGPSSATTIDNESLNSGTAERFYRPPWDPENPAPNVERESFFYRQWYTSTSPVEQVIEVPAESEDDDQPTAKALNTAIHVQPSPGPRSPLSPRSPGEALEAIEIILDTNPEQARGQQVLALSQLDRMETWLAAQRAYLPSVSGEDTETEEETIPRHLDSDATKAGVATARPPPFILPQDAPSESEAREEEQEQPVVLAKKKSVRFSEVPKPRFDSRNNNPCQLPSKLFRKESAYYRAFINYMIRQSPTDVFVHRQPRFEALQAQRASLQEAHRCQLLGKYQLSVVPQSLKKRLSANVARGDAELVDDPERLRRDKETEAMDQMSMALWHVAAMKLLAGGRLIRAPVSQRLSRLSRMAPGPDGVPRDRARILDLGGQATCDWAWHCAYQYPNTKIYTVTTTAIRQLSNSNIRGPPNHRQVAVEKLTQLPFKDDQFDLISARELHAILKSSGVNGEDEWDACLQECMRVLKPGGYIEFSVLDSDMISPGPLGLAKSVEFGFTLKTLGYDPTPTKAWLSRLSNAGFEDIRRAWVCLPMGEKPVSKNRAPATRTSTTGLEAVRGQPSESAVTGGTGAVAAVCGIAAGWSWERWLLRCETEKVASERRLGIAEAATTGEAVKEAAGNCLVDVHSVIEEGRACGAAWRMVTGWARKPRAEMEIISIGLAE